MAVVVEGYTDVLMAHQRGVTSAVATLGTALTHEHARVLRRMADRILLLFDGDNAGTLAAERGIEILLANDLDVIVVPLEKGTDPCDFFRGNDAESFQRFTAENGQDFFDFSLRNLTQRHDIRTPGGRARIAREMFRLVAALGDPIRQDLVLHRTAEALDIREELLRREFLKSRDSAGPRGGPGRPASGARKNAAPFAPADGRAEIDGRAESGSAAMAEEDLLLGLVKQPDLIDRFRADIERIDLEGRSLRKIMEMLLRADRDGPLRPKELLLLLREDEEAKNRLIALLTEARRTEPEELVSAALGFLATRSREKRYRQIRRRQK
jgi:DNA primase